ncbi:hypothetical protein [Yoonia maricola]|uniref:hypothetical protein n=1 Tax=Yoonia maricola TaxID=420999 RepID=UPI001054B284|nr:hypothetical protein [Yoonia maricola]
MTKQVSADAAISYLNACAGRFIFLITTPKFTRLYVDAAASLGAVYDLKDKSIAATLNLVLTRDTIINDDYPLTKLAMASKARFAFGHTADKYVKRVLPNHYLDMDTLAQHRFWDGAQDIIDIKPADEARALDEIAERLAQIMASLSNHFPDTKLPITGGLDSRVLLACAKPIVSQLSLYSHAENMMSRKDTRIAGRLASIMGQPMAVYDPTRNPDVAIDDESRLTMLSNAGRIANAEGDIETPIPSVRLSTLNAVPEGGVVVRGNVGGLMRAMPWRREIARYKNGKPLRVQSGLRLMMLTDSETLNALPPSDRMKLTEAYENWYSAFSGTAAERAYDLQFVEQFISHGQGNHFYSFTHNFYLHAYCDRKFITRIISLPPDRRAELRYTEAIISARAPELCAMKYTRKNVTMRLKENRAEDPNWFLS